MGDEPATVWMKLVRSRQSRQLYRMTPCCTCCAYAHMLHGVADIMRESAAGGGGRGEEEEGGPQNSTKPTMSVLYQ